MSDLFDIPADPIEERSAVLSDDGLYRYELRRRWAPGPLMCYVMLNPSTADAEQDDPTIRRCRNLAKREGCGGFVAVNLFAYRTAYPKELWRARRSGVDINGAQNWDHVRAAIGDAETTVAAWGALPRAHLRRSVAGTQLLEWRHDVELLCLGRCTDGSPRHPLMVERDVKLERWP